MNASFVSKAGISNSNDITVTPVNLCSRVFKVNCVFYWPADGLDDAVQLII